MEYLFIALAIFTAILIINTNNITYAALGLLSVTMCGGCVCFCYNAPFVGIIQMLICTTTTLLLLLFGSMFAVKKVLKISKLYLLLPIIFYIFITSFLKRIILYTENYTLTENINIEINESNTLQLGKEIACNYPWAFEFIGIMITIILVVVVGICNKIEK